MRASRRFSVVALLCLSNLRLPGLAAAQLSDQVVAERLLGPQWKQLSRRAGMIFTGTVLGTAPQTVTAQTAPTDRLAPGMPPSVHVSFRVDHAIAGVEPGQILTIREWVGAGAMQRPMRQGQRILIFLYPPSRLGLTSPVGGSRGQVALDPSGENVSEVRQTSAPISPAGSVVQLERAIRSARNEEE